MQLVYFNDLHKNLGCNRGITAKISIIPVTFTVLPVKFHALQLPPIPIFFSPFSPSADKCPAATDISIVQKTCEFRRLIYQFLQMQQIDISVCIQPIGGVPLPSAHCIRSHLPQGDGFWRWRESFWLKRKAACPEVNPLRHRCAMPPPPKGGGFALLIGKW